jgi:uncharacterized protein YjbJ (UPF0337 family)
MSFNSNSSGPDKTSGKFHYVKGSINETVRLPIYFTCGAISLIPCTLKIGNVTGMKDWRRDGQAEHRAGEAEYDAARSKGYVEGLGDRISGKKDAVLGAVTNDKSQQAQGKITTIACSATITSYGSTGNVRHDKGQTQQDINNL